MHEGTAKKSDGVKRTLGTDALGAACSGVLEIAIFHPVDTVAKRLMSNTEPVFTKLVPASAGAEATVHKCSTAEGMQRLKSVVFREHAGQSVFNKWKSLYPGVGFGATYKIMQRTYKFSMQPILKDYFAENHGKSFRAAFGDKGGRDMMHACAGACVGLGEVALLPVDALKIKAQVNPESLKGRGVFTIFREEGFRKLYRGWNWTAIRNMPGSFALFGSTSVVYSWVFNTDRHNATIGQIFAASLCGGVSSIAISSPMDVIKTRVQNRAFSDPRTGMALVRDLVREEGVHAFFKGLTPKIGLIGPKLIFSWTVAQWLSRSIAKAMADAE